MKPITLGYNILHGGDLDENNFWKSETNHSWLHNFAWGDLNGHEHFKTKQATSGIAEPFFGEIENAIV